MDEGERQRIASDVSHVIEELTGLMNLLDSGEHALAAYQSANAKFIDIGDVLGVNYPPMK